MDGCRRAMAMKKKKKLFGIFFLNAKITVQFPFWLVCSLFAREINPVAFVLCFVLCALK
jgi:hypothetical protein